MQASKAILLVMALALAACTYGKPIGDAASNSPGLPSDATFRHLSLGLCPWLGADASATVIAPGWAVTNAHAAFMLPAEHYASAKFDLAFARIDGGEPLPLGTAQTGDRVWIYGVGCGTGGRFAEGTIVAADAKQCWGSAVRSGGDAVDMFCARSGRGTAPGFIVAADIGPGFSGGPVVNAKGELVGVVQGTLSQPIGDLPQGKLGFAYHVRDVVFAGWPAIVAHNTETRRTAIP